MKRSIAFHPLLTLFIFFQFIAILLTPNLSSYTGKRIAPYLLPYMYGLGLPGTWSFFAPEPFSPPIFLDYVITKKNGEEISGRFPDESKFFLRSRKNRWQSFTRYLLMKEAMIEHMFMNFLCNQYKGVSSAEIWSVRGMQPDLEMVRDGRKLSQTVDYQTEFIGNFACSETEKV